MDNRDRQVLNKIHNHIISVLKYCENCEDLESFQRDSKIGRASCRERV